MISKIEPLNTYEFLFFAFLVEHASYFLGQTNYVIKHKISFNKIIIG